MMSKPIKNIIFDLGGVFLNIDFQLTNKAFIDLGVNAIICHHSHSIGPVEVYKNAPIFYGLGNFIFPRDGKPTSWNIGLIVQIEFDNENIGWKIIPFRQKSSSRSKNY